MSLDSWDRMRREAARSGAANSTEPRMGVVTSYDPVQYAVKVLILPEGVFPDDPEENGETGWIPLGTQWAGNGWGDNAPPALGTQVHIGHQESDTGAGIVQHQLHDERNAPMGTPAGERWIQHESGAAAKWTNDGNLALTAPKGDLNLTAVNTSANPSGTLNINLQGASIVIACYTGTSTVTDGGKVSGTTAGMIKIVPTNTNVFDPNLITISAPLVAVVGTTVQVSATNIVLTNLPSAPPAGADRGTLWRDSNNFVRVV